MRRGRPLQRGKPLAQRSAKKIASDAVLAQASRARQARTGGWCEGTTPACPRGPHRGHHAHHVKRRSQGGQHTVGNLRWLCFDGHQWVHANVADARALGLLA